MRAEPGELRRVHEPVLKDRLKEYARAGRLAGDGHHRRLKIRREAGIRLGNNMPR